jgi:hypothetical protein
MGPIIARARPTGRVDPLEVGGANVIANLWPEPKAEAKTKDVLEAQMHSAVCRGNKTLAQAQAVFLAAATPTTIAPVTAAPATQPPATQPPATEPPATEPPATDAPAPQAPAGATALCVDGSYSYSQTRSGTCSHHGGVAQWL